MIVLFRLKNRHSEKKKMHVQGEVERERKRISRLWGSRILSNTEYYETLSQFIIKKTLIFFCFRKKPV